MNDNSKSQRRYIDELHKAWRDEKASALTYAAASERESDERRKSLFLRMAEEEMKHAARLEQRLRDLNASPGAYAETEAEIARRDALFKDGTAGLAQAMEAAELRAGDTYAQLVAQSPTEEDKKEFLEIAQEEQSHNLVLKKLSHPVVSPGQLLEGILSREKHMRGGGWIGQAVYGINDGLGAAFGVVSGVAGATHVNGSFVLISGFATMIASALSMGSGAYLSEKAEREVHEAEMERERKEIAEHPLEERQELSLFYQLKGFSEAEADAMAARMAESPSEMLKTIAHEELGLSEQTFPNPWRSAISATAATALGAGIPVLPYIFTTGVSALLLSFVISTLAHFGVGAAKVIITGRNWWKSGLEMMLIGLGEAAITYVIGLLVSPVIGG